MTAMLPVITGRFVVAAAPRSGTGKGVVETVTDGDRAVILCGSQKITLQLTSGSLRQGDEVVFKAQGDEVVIERLSASTLRPAIPVDAFDTDAAGGDEALQAMLRQLARQLERGPVDGETLDRLSLALTALSEKTAAFDAASQDTAQQLIGYALPILRAPQASEKLDALRCAQLLQILALRLTVSATTPFLRIKPGVSEGYYYCATADEARQWAKLAGVSAPQADDGEVEDLVSNAPVVFRVYGGDTDAVRCTVMSSTNAVGQLLHSLRSDVSDPFWKSITAETLMALLAQRGCVEPGRLSDIDRMLMEKNMNGLELTAPGATADGGPACPASDSARSTMQVQWLSIACDPSIPLGAVPPPPQLGMAAAIAQWAENTPLRWMADMNAQESLLNTNTFFLSRQSIDSNVEKQTVLTRAMRTVGLDFENALALRAPPIEGEAAPLTSLKALLLQSLGKAETRTPAQPLESLEKSRSQLQRIVAIALRETADLFDGLSNASDASAETLRRRLQAGLQSFASEVASAFDASIQPILRRILDQLEESLNDIVSRFCEKEKTDPAAVNDTQSRAPGQEVFRRSILDFKAAVQETAHGAEQAIGNAAQRMDRAITEALLRPDTHTTAQHAESRQAEGSQQLHSALNRIDSLQILAKPVATAMGEQRVVVLPMKIDGQWNDVVVKFVKDRRRRGGKKAAHAVSVALHVAPALLGNIDVNMEYTAQRSVTIGMCFEKDAVCSWFERNKAALAEAIRCTGIAMVHLSMYKKKPSGGHDGALLRRSPTSTIDIVA